MKKTIKRIITAILAVSTVASTAVLFAGCGEKSEEEKAKDAIKNAYNSYKNAADESSEEVEKVELNLLDKIVSDKLYTLKFLDGYNGGFYIRLNDTIDIDGYTVELRDKTRDKTDEYNSGWKEWVIKKDGEELAWFEMDRDTYPIKEINNNKIVVQINAKGILDPAKNSDVEFEFTETRRDDVEIDVPAELTQDECKQHMDELKEAASDEYNNYLKRFDYSNPQLYGVYYFPVDAGDDSNAANARVVFAYSANDSSNRDCVFYVEMERPFIFDGELNFFRINSDFLGIKSEVESGNPYGSIDLSKGTKIG